MNGILGLLLIAFTLYAYCALMDYAFKKAVGESSVNHLETPEVNPPATTQTTLEDFHIKFCAGCNKRTGFSCGECNLCALPTEDADLKPAPQTHMQWAKARALAELPNCMLAIASMTSDMGKHPDTEQLQPMCALFAMTAPTPATTRAFIEGFNDALGVNA